MSRKRPGSRSLLTCLTLAGVLVATSPLAAATVRGTVVYSGKVPSFRPLNLDGDPACAAQHSAPVYPETLVLGDGNTMANVLVEIVHPPAAKTPPPRRPVVVDQAGCIYHPHVAVVRAGQPILFKNSDGVLHNVHGRPAVNPEFNLVMLPTMKEKEITLEKPEAPFPVKCDVHPWMQSWLAVSAGPYAAVTGKDGRFEIGGLPAGTYEVRAWHEKLGTRTAEVTLGADETKGVDFTFSVPK